MSKVVLEENGVITLLEDEENSSLFIQLEGEEYPLKKGKSQIKNNFKNWIVTGAEIENQKIITVMQSKKENYEDIQIWVYNQEGKYTGKKLYDTSDSYYYDYETLFEIDANNDDTVGFIYSQIDDSGDTNLVSNNLGNLSVTGASIDGYSSILYKKANKFVKAETKSWFSIAAETINNQNYLVQVNKKNKYLKIYQGENADWIMKKISFVKPTSNSYYQWELDTNKDLNEDGFVGFELLPFEGKGELSSYKNVLEQIYTYEDDEYIPTYFNDKQISLNNFPNQILIGLDKKDGANKMVWKHNSGNLIEWSMDNNWNFQESQLAQYQSYDYFVIENYLKQDINEDNIEGLDTVDYQDSKGNTFIVIDSFSQIYGILSTATGDNIDDYNPIYHKGNQINTKTFSGYTINGLESIENDNYLLLESSSGDLKKYKLNADGVTSEYEKIKYQSELYFETEEKFDQDFDGDGKIGFVMDEPFESLGMVSLVTDQVSNIYADESNSAKKSIKYNNKQVSVNQFDSLTMLGAEKDINSNNIIAWENEESALSVWKLDNDWNYLSYKNIATASIEYYSVEGQFLQDFDGDGTTGFSYTEVETDGITSLKVDEQIGFAFVDTFKVQQNNTYSFEGYSVVEETTAIKYQGSEVVEDSFNKQFGMYLLGAESTENQQLVAWADGDLNLTIWETNDEWEYKKSTNVNYNTSDFLEYESIFNQDWNDDDVIGGQSSIIEEDKFVSLSSDQLGFIIVTIAEENFEVGYNGQKLNLNTEWWDSESNNEAIVSYSLLAAEYNLWNNQVENQLAWGHYEENILTKVLLWEMNNDWSDLLSITEVIKTEDELDNDFKLLELSFDTDLDNNSTVGNGYEGFYAFNNSINIDNYGNTILNQSSDGLQLYVIEDSLYIPGENKNDNSIELKSSDNAQSIISYLSENNLTPISAETINGVKTLIVQGVNAIYNISFNNNWKIDTSTINLNSSKINFSTKKFNDMESFLNIDIDEDNIIGKSDNNYSAINIESDGEYDLVYSQQTKKYGIKYPNGEIGWIEESMDNILGLTNTSSIIGVEVDDAITNVLVNEGNGVYVKNSFLYDVFSIEGNSELIESQEYNFNNIESSESTKQDFEELETEFGVEIDNNGILGSQNIIDNNGDILLMQNSSGQFTIQSQSTDEKKEISIKNQILFSGSKFLKKWNILAAEKINGQNQILLKSKVSSKIKVWNFDENWKYQYGNVKFNMASQYNLEKQFGVDLNNDSVQGSMFSSYEVGGSISLFTDIQGNLGINSQFLEDPVYIKKNKNTLFNIESIKGYSAQGADIFNGQNTVVFSNKGNEKIKVSTFNDSWNKHIITKVISSNKNLYFDYEIAFDQDFNGDGFTGMTFTSLESDGIKLKKSLTGYAYASDLTNKTMAIGNKKGKGLKVNSKNWSIAAVTESESINLMAMLNKSSSKLKVYKMNDDWEIDKLIKSVSSKDESFFELEENFQHDFNKDSLIGNGFLEIESNGIILKQDQFGMAFANTGLDNNIKITNKKGAGLKVDTSNWDIIALTEADSINYMAKQNNSGTKIKIYQMGESWSANKLLKTISYNNVNDILYAEQLFDQTLFE